MHMFQYLIERFGMVRRLLLPVVSLLALSIALPPIALAQDDEYELLPEGDGRDETFGMCSGCHSIKLVVQQGLSRERWDELLDYMVEEQGMPELDDETRGIVLDYLDEHLNTDHRPDYIKR